MYKILSFLARCTIKTTVGINKFVYDRYLIFAWIPIKFVFCPSFHVMLPLWSYALASQNINKMFFHNTFSFSGNIPEKSTVGKARTSKSSLIFLAITLSFLPLPSDLSVSTVEALLLFIIDSQQVGLGGRQKECSIPFPTLRQNQLYLNLPWQMFVYPVSKNLQSGDSKNSLGNLFIYFTILTVRELVSSFVFSNV